MRIGSEAAVQSIALIHRPEDRNPGSGGIESRFPGFASQVLLEGRRLCILFHIFGKHFPNRSPDGLL